MDWLGGQPNGLPELIWECGVGKKDYPWIRYWQQIVPAEPDAETDPTDINERLILSRWADHPAPFTLDTLPDAPCIILVGENGMGKTYAAQDYMRRLQHDRATRPDTPMLVDLGEGFSTRESLWARIFDSGEFGSWRESANNLHILLDSLDECFLEFPSVGKVLVSGVCQLDADQRTRIRLRIFTRYQASLVSLSHEFRGLFGEDAVFAFELLPLSHDQISLAAGIEGVDGDQFLDEVDRLRIGDIASRPVILNMLLAQHKQGGLSNRRWDLYERACQTYCGEPSPRRHLRTSNTVTTIGQRLRIAGRIAAAALLCGKSGVSDPDAERCASSETDLPVESQIGGQESLEGRMFDVTLAGVRETLATGLFTVGGLGRFRWIHRSIAEFLAAWYLASLDLEPEILDSLLRLPQSLDPRQTIVPQLEGLAAWLAVRDRDWFDRLVTFQPELLLWSDLESWQRPELARSILAAAAAGLINDFDYGWRRQYHKLSHSGLADQLRPYIQETSEWCLSRRIAIEIAKACRVTELGPILLDIALDPAQDIYIRRSCIETVGSFRDGTLIGRLLPVVRGVAGLDPDDELKGAALGAMWPEWLNVQQLLDSLTPPHRENLDGSYVRFVNWELTKSLDGPNLRTALRWILESGWDQNRHHWREDIVQLILAKAAEDEAQAVGCGPLVDFLVRALQSDRFLWLVIGSQHGFGRISWPAAVRQGVLEKLVPAGQLNKLQPFLCPDDLPWMTGRLNSADTEQDRKRWTEAIGEVAIKLGDAALMDERFLPALAAADRHRCLKDHLDRVSVHLHRVQAQRVAEEKQASDGLAQRTIVLQGILNDASQPAFMLWRQAMSEGFSFRPPIDLNLDKVQQWTSLDNDLRERVIEKAVAASGAVPGDLNCPAPGRRDGTTFYWHWALLFTARMRPAALETFPVAIWETWIPRALGFDWQLWFVHHKASRDVLARLAQQAVPEAVASALAHEITERGPDPDSDLWSVLHVLDCCWNERISERALQAMQQIPLAPKHLRSLLRTLFKRNYRPAAEWGLSLMNSADRSTEPNAERFVILASELLGVLRGWEWDQLWSGITSESEFGNAVFSEICRSGGVKDYYLDRRSPNQLAEVYIWLERVFPERERKPPTTTLSAASLSEDAYWWRNAVLQRLQQSGSEQETLALERIARELPHLTGIPWAAKANKRRVLDRQWRPPAPNELHAMTGRRSCRQIRDSQDLLSVLKASLDRLAALLQGDNSMADFLWNECEHRGWTPKVEIRLSAFIAHHLRTELARDKGVIVNREVVIRDYFGGDKGQRTDLLIEAIPFDDRSRVFAPAKVIIEVKRCDHREVLTAPRDQLARRYMADNPGAIGLYVVGWYCCQQWTCQRGGHCSIRGDVGTARAEFQRLAVEVSESEGVPVEAFVLRTHLR